MDPHYPDSARWAAVQKQERAVKNKKRNHKRKKKKTACISCGTPLGIPGGMGGTDLCGPCCTGEAETLDEIGETW